MPCDCDLIACRGALAVHSLNQCLSQCTGTALLLQIQCLSQCIGTAFTDSMSVAVYWHCIHCFDVCRSALALHSLNRCPSQCIRTAFTVSMSVAVHWHCIH